MDAERRQPTFEFFSKLPVEVQLMIWEHAVGKGPTMVVLPDTSFKKVRHQCCKSELKWSSAALLATCRLSREVATRVCMTIVYAPPHLAV